jgi:hypothetical protein
VGVFLEPGDGALLATGMIDSSILIFDVQAALDRSNAGVSPEPKGSRANLLLTPSTANSTGP